jgi:hypothetical protein
MCVGYLFLSILFKASLHRKTNFVDYPPSKIMALRERMQEQKKYYVISLKENAGKK